MSVITAALGTVSLAATIAVTLDKPLVRGEDQLAQLTFRRPTTPVLLDMSLSRSALPIWTAFARCSPAPAPTA